MLLLDMKFHALFVNHYAITPSEIGGLRHFNLAANLLKNGINVLIVCSSVEHKRNIQRFSKLPHLPRLEQVKGVYFLRLWVPAFSSGYLRILNMLIFSIQVLFLPCILRFKSITTIVGSTIHPFAAAACAFLSFITRKRYIYEVRDLWPETLIEFGVLSRHSFFARMLCFMEHYCASCARYIVSTMPNIDDYFLAYYPSFHSKIVWISNGCNLYLKPPNREIEPHATASHSCKNFIYFGAIGTANNVESIVYAVQSISISNPSILQCIHITIIGEGKSLDLTKNLVHKYSLSTFFTFLPFMDKSILFDYAVHNADCFLLPLHQSPALYNYGISMNKLFDYLSIGKPIIIHGYFRDKILKSSSCILATDSISATSFAEKIIQISLLSKCSISSLSSQALDLAANHYDNRQLASKYSQLLMPD